MRLNERDSQIAAAAVQILERELADRLEEHPEAGFAPSMSRQEREAFDRHDRITQIVRKLATGGDHELFDWEAQLVREALHRYEAVLSDQTLIDEIQGRDKPPSMLIADEDARYITTEAQRRRELQRTQSLLEKFARVGS